MPFVIVKHMDVGTEHPVVARLAIQTDGLLKWADLSENVREEINYLYADTLVARLVRCEEDEKSIRTKMEEEIVRVRLKFADKAQMSEIPYIVGLEGHCEHFLYEAKNYLRDLLKVFGIAYGCEIADASAFGDMKGNGDGDLVKWAAKQFGAKDTLVLGLRANQPWLTELIRKRNAVEHPGGKSGSLDVQNLRVKFASLIPPTWSRTNMPQTMVLDDMREAISNLLNLAEDLVANIAIRKMIQPQIVDIYEIPLDQRDPKCPVRLKINLNSEFSAKLAEQHGQPSKESS